MDGIEKKNAEDIGKWLLGLVFSAGIATLQNFRNKREQAKVFRAQVQEIHDIVKPQSVPAITDGSESSDPDKSALTPAVRGDDLRTIVERIQQQLTNHQSRGDERHAANIARFEAIEKSQERVGDDLLDLRKVLRHNRGETRTMMKKILTKLSDLGDGSHKEKESV